MELRHVNTQQLLLIVKMSSYTTSLLTLNYPPLA